MTKLTDKEIDKKVEAIGSLMGHWGWSSFVEVVQIMQGTESSKLFKKSFLDLEPIVKDREHRAIVKVVDALEKILQLPQWLEKRKPGRWAEVQQYLMETKND